MSPLFMDTGYEPNSPGSLSPEECHSNTAGSEREGDGPPTGRRGTKRREKNRDAARKSRKKQTERADELHEELQCLERSNSALQKEIAALKKDFQHYTTVLDRHEPYCHLRASPSSTSPTSFSNDRHASSSSPRVPPQPSNSISSSSLSTSLTSSMILQTRDCVERTRLSPLASAATTTTLASPAGLTAELFPASSSSSSSSSTTTSPVTNPYSVSFSTDVAPHSLFCDRPVTSRPANVKPASLLSNHAPLTQSGQDTLHVASPVSNPSFTVDAFLTKQAPFPTASPPNALPPYPRLETENKRVVAQPGHTNLPRPLPCHFRGNPDSSLYKLLPSPLADPVSQSLCVPPQDRLEPPIPTPFLLKPRYNEVTPSTASLLSLLTVPSPLDVSQTTSRSLAQPPPPPQPSVPLKDLSLSELLEINDWILGANPTE